MKRFSTRRVSCRSTTSLRRCIVLGGGIIGAEYASFFAALGTEVTVVDKRDHLLPLLDQEIGLASAKSALDVIGLKFVGNKDTDAIAKTIKTMSRFALKMGQKCRRRWCFMRLGSEANVAQLTH